MIDTDLTDRIRAEFDSAAQRMSAADVGRFAERRYRVRSRRPAPPMAAAAGVVVVLLAATLAAALSTRAQNRNAGGTILASTRISRPAATQPALTGVRTFSSGGRTTYVLALPRLPAEASWEPGWKLCYVVDRSASQPTGTICAEYAAAAKSIRVEVQIADGRGGYLTTTTGWMRTPTCTAHPPICAYLTVTVALTARVSVQR